MMKRISKYLSTLPTVGLKGMSVLVIVAVLLGAVACDTVVDIDIPREAPKLVVNALIGTDEPVIAQVSLSKSVLDNSNLSFVSGAEVVLLEEGTVVATLENDTDVDQNGLYRSSFSPEAGKNYTLQVSKSGYDPVEATTYIPLPIAIQALSYDTSVVINTYQSDDSVIVDRLIGVDEVRLTFDDPAGEKNYYEVTALRYAFRYEYQYDEQGFPVYDTLDNPVIADTIVSFFPVGINSDDPVLSGGGDLLEGDGDTYGDYLTFSDDFIDGKRYTFRFQPSGNYYSSVPEENRYVIVLRTLSEAQYLYFTSNALQYETADDPFAEPAQVYNNIENGYGIFAGYSSDQVVLDFE